MKLTLFRRFSGLDFRLFLLRLLSTVGVYRFHAPGIYRFSKVKSTSENSIDIVGCPHLLWHHFGTEFLGFATLAEDRA
jgi:hypothetical protein